MQVTLDGVIGSLQGLERCRTVDEFADRSIDLLWDLIPSEDLSFNEFDEGCRRTIAYRLRSVNDFEEDSEEAFWSYADDLPICWGIPPGAAGVVRTQDIVSRRELRSMKVYAEVLHPYGVEFEMKMAFESPTWISRAFIFSRSDREFTEREAERARLVAPHLAAAYRRLRTTLALTAREAEILELVARGLTNREIAAQLDISPGTVRSHLEHAFAKLSVGTRTAAVAALR
jgi:DNA-binding CsgD family transcriptional regulator